MNTPTAQPRLSFDRLAASFDDQRSLPTDAITALHGAFGDLADAGLETLIEPGAGTGRIAIPALVAGLRVTALDVSHPMLDVLESRLAPLPEIAARCEVVVGNATDLPFDDDTFDAGMLAQVLYLIPDWQRAIDELVRVVRPGGRVMLLQERTVMSPELSRWDVAWREATAGVGHVDIPQEPDDVTAVATLAERVGEVAECQLASWSFGQTVAQALAGLDRMRPLYESLPNDAWKIALASFRAWEDGSKLAGSTHLDGTVMLTLVSGIVPASR